MDKKLNPLQTTFSNATGKPGYDSMITARSPRTADTGFSRLQRVGVS
jgi:hypothetical protein